MPRNSVTDLITDQEIAFAHLLLSGKMNDRQAAEAAGLNPTTASYTKSKPRVRNYMDQHRAAVNEKRVEQEAEGLRQLDLTRGQILARLWELANVSPDATKGSIAGQVKALSIIATIEGLLPNRVLDRRLPPAVEPSVAPAAKPQIYVSEWLRSQADPATESAESVPAVQAQPATPPSPEPPKNPAGPAPSPVEEYTETSHDQPFNYPKGESWAPNAIGPALEAYNTTTSPFRPAKRRFGRTR